MKKSRYTDSQIISILKQAEAGTPDPDLCREHGMSSATFYKCRAVYDGMDASRMAQQAATEKGLSIRLACETFSISRSSSWTKTTRSLTG